MANASSSAVRADTVAPPVLNAGSGGDPYGSLAGLGAPKKFKKKPVLVLDPEELAKAHQMFQEASAEILGEEAPRAAKQPSTLLGLAPMDDEEASADDMGVEDETADDGEEFVTPNAEDVMKMTKGRAGMDPDDAAMAAQALEDGFDEEHRIFPTLPMKSEDEIAAQEAAELAAAPAVEEDVTVPTPVELAEPTPLSEPAQTELPPVDEESFVFEPAAATQPEEAAKPVKPIENAATPAPPIAEGTSLFERMSALGANSSQLLNNSVLPEPEPIIPAQIVPTSVKPAPIEPEPIAEDAAPQEPIAPIEPVAPNERAEPMAQALPDPIAEPVPEQPVEAASVPMPEPMQEVEPEPTQPAYAEPEEPFYEEELAEDAEDEIEWPALSTSAPADKPTPAADFGEEIAAPSDARAEDTSFTKIDDDDESVDGYAFMYASNPRGRINRVAPEGRQNNLRAKLVKERAAEEQSAGSYESASLWSRFATWWRGLFS